MNVADLPLFGTPRARHSDPETSHRAARSLGSQADAQRHAILCALERAGVRGATNDELDTLLGWRTGTASRRVAELVRPRYGVGPVVRLTMTRPTVAGRAAHVHVLRWLADQAERAYRLGKGAME